MGPIWGRQDPGGPHVGPMNFAIWGEENICKNKKGSDPIHVRGGNLNIHYTESFYSGA